MKVAKKMPAKNKTTKQPRIKIDWAALVNDQEFMDSISLLGTLLVARKRRPCVRQQVLNTIGALTTMLLAMDNEFTETLRLLDEDCLGDSATGQIVKPVKRKKRIRRG